MRSEGQIRHQLRQVTFRHLQKRLRGNFRQRPDTCTFNQSLMYDGRIQGVCGFQEGGEPRLILCDSQVPGCTEMARTCPLWQPQQTKEDLKDEFLHLLQGDRGLLAVKYPDIAALMWVLDSAGEPLSAVELQALVEIPGPTDQVFKPESPQAQEPEAPGEPTFWGRFWHRGGH